MELINHQQWPLPIHVGNNNNLKHLYIIMCAYWWVTIMSHVRPKISEKEKELILGSIKDFIKKSLENLRVVGKERNWTNRWVPPVTQNYPRELWGGLCILHPMPPHCTDSKGWPLLSTKECKRKEKNTTHWSKTHIQFVNFNLYFYKH